MLNGTPNEFTTFNGVPVPVDAQMLFYPFWGTDNTFPLFAAPWAWAMDTPFKWTKQVASHFGGTAQGMAMSWPGHINDVGGTRRQFHHLIDIVPTILEATAIPIPETLNGIKQRPMDGVSMAYTWNKASANAASRRPTQYFEMLGNRAIYHEDWVANTTPATLPWELSSAPPPDNTSLSRWNAPKPNLTADRKVFTYSGGLTGVPNSGAPSILNKAYTITAEITIPAEGAEGMIVTDGGRFDGYGLFLSPSFNWWDKADLFRNLGLGFLAIGLLLVWRGRNKNWSRLKMSMSYIVVIFGSLLVVAVVTTRMIGIGRGKLVFLYNLLDLKRTTWVGPELSAGKHIIVFDFKSDGPGLGKGGTGILSVDGKEVARNSMEHATPITFPEDETFDIGQDTRTGVALLEYRYDVPFKFTGTINKLTFNLRPEQLTAEEHKQLPVIADAVARAKD